jgi:Stress responsive A/B Barrel Domain
MVDHVVLLALREGVADADLAHLGELLDGLPSKIGGIAYVRYGPSSSPEGLEQGYAYGFVVGFVDATARDRYLPHPEHAPVSAAVGRIAERVLVFDVGM